MRQVIGMRRLVPAIMLVTFAGCAPLVSTQITTAEYVCEGGADMRLRTTGDAADIEIAGMKLGLLAEESAGAEQRYACSMLTVKLSGDTARVEMEGKPYLDSCRLKEHKTE